MDVPCPEGIGLVEDRVAILFLLGDIHDFEGIAAFDSFEEPLRRVGVGNHAETDDEKCDEGEFAVKDFGDHRWLVWGVVAVIQKHSDGTIMENLPHSNLLPKKLNLGFNVLYIYIIAHYIPICQGWVF